MSKRLEKLVAIAVKPMEVPTGSDNILLKVCPRCQMPHSRYDTQCQRCTKKAKRIEHAIQVREIGRKRESGEAVSKDEQELLKRYERLLDLPISQEDLDFLEMAPFELPEQAVVVRPSFKNRLQFFLDRMRDEGRKVTTTQAAAKLLKFDEGGFVNKKDFVDFATDHGVRPLMSADWEQLFAAWRVEDILKLLRAREAERAASKMREKKPGKTMGSAEAAAALGIAGTKTFMDFATSNGVKPAKAFGDRPEQILWHTDDIEALRHLWKLETDLRQLEEAEQRVKRTLVEVQKPPMKWPQMQEMRKRKQDLALIRDSLEKVRLQREREAARLQELAEKREQVQAEGKKASDTRLAKILAMAANPTKTQRTALLDKIYDISGRAIKEILSHKDLANLLEPDRLEQASEGVLSFDEIMGSMLDTLNLTPLEGAKLPPDELKRLNTTPSARNCASCGGPLSDPGMGPAFKHCPACEP